MLGFGDGGGCNFRCTDFCELGRVMGSEYRLDSIVLMSLLCDY